MDEREKEERSKIVQEALTWLGTPYHHTGRVKGAGTDCGMLILQCFITTGLIDPVKVGAYAMDWHLHRSEQLYLGWVERYCKKVDRETPLPGDVIVYQYGRCVSHGALVVEWPTIIHAYVGLGVVLADGSDPELRKRQRGIYSHWSDA
jgi:cell wall-associated NlpC family hydrolase